MRFTRRQFGQALTAALMVSAMVGAAQAQDAWPVKPVTVIVPYNAGGPMDVMGRIILDKVSDSLGQRFLIESRPGAASAIGSDYVARAEPDGYTLLFASAPALVTLKLTKGSQLSFDPMTDLVPVMTVSRRPYVMFLDPKLGFASAGEFVEAARANPGLYSYSSTGAGGADFFLTEYFKHLSGTDLLHVPYSGGAAAIQAVENGEVSLFFGGLTQYQQYGATGRLAALGVTSVERVSQAPELPPLPETVPGLESYVSIDFFAPKGTPPEIIETLRSEIAAAIQFPDVLPKVLDSGELSDASSEAILAGMVAELETLQNLVETLDLELDLD